MTRATITGCSLFSLQRDTQTTGDWMFSYGLYLEPDDDKNVPCKAGGTQETGRRRQVPRTFRSGNQYLKGRSNSDRFLVFIVCH